MYELAASMLLNLLLLINCCILFCAPCEWGAREEENSQLMIWVVFEGENSKQMMWVDCRSVTTNISQRERERKKFPIVDLGFSHCNV